MNNIVKVQNLKKSFKTANETLEILSDINLNINKGELISITGESGSGKSTLLHLIGGLDLVTEGEIFVNSINITAMNESKLSYFRNKTIGFIFQSHYLLEEFNALENVMIPYLMNNYNKKIAREKALYLLNMVGLDNRVKHHPSKMSGGERQRVAIARAFINEPILILADEPTGNLDNMNSDKVVNLLFNITDRMKHSLIIVTHSESIANMADRNYHLNHGVLQ